MSVRRALSVAGWNALLLLGVALLAEAVFGGWLRGGGLGALHVPREVTLRHDVSKVRPGGGIALYRRDRWGFRGRFDDPAEIRILAVGGSTTNQLYHDESETWTAVLERRFAEAGRRVAVANAGVDGHSTVGHIASFDYWFSRVPGLRPTLVLFYVGINDVQVEDHERYDAIVPADFLGRARRYISNNSALAGLFRAVRGMIRARRARVVYRNAPPQLRPVTARVSVDPAAYADRLAAYADRLRVLAGKTRRIGARPVFIDQRRGDAFVIGGRMMATGPAAVAAREVQALYNRITMAVCREVGGVCIDLAREIDLAPGDFVDSIHTNPEGSRKIGDYLYEKLRDLLPPEGSGGQAQAGAGTAER